MTAETIVNIILAISVDTSPFNERCKGGPVKPSRPKISTDFENLDKFPGLSAGLTDWKHSEGVGLGEVNQVSRVLTSWGEDKLGFAIDRSQISPKVGFSLTPRSQFG